MFRGQFQDYFLDTMLPALDATATKGFKAKPKMFDKVLNTDSIGGGSGGIKQFSSVIGMGLPTQVAEGADTPVDSMVPGFKKTYTPVKFGLGVAATQELVEDDKFGIITQRARRLGESIQQHIEINGASVINNAFDGTNYAGPDGKALCASDHPLIKGGGTQNNLLAAAADLDVTSLELALTDYALMKDQRGFLQQLSKPRVLTAEQNRWNVIEILKSQMRSDTANNTDNAFKYDGGPALEPLIWSYLTDPDAWFLVAPPSETGLLWLWRKQPWTDSDFVKKSQTGVLYMWYRADFGFHDWTGIYGTPGA